MKSIFAGAMVAGLLCSACGARQAAAQTTPPSAPAAATAREEETISLNFPENMDIKVLIEYVGKRLGISFLYDAAIGTQKTTIKSSSQVTQSALLPLLQSILQAKGYVIVDMGQPGWKQITPVKDLGAHSTPTTLPAARGAAAAMTQVFVLKHLDSARADQIIKPFLSQPGGSSSAIPEQHLLIVTDYGTNLPRLNKLIDMIDRPRTEAAVQFYTLQHADASILAPQLDQLIKAKINNIGGAGPSNPPVEVGFDARTNQIALVGLPDRVAEAIGLIKKLDVSVGLQTRSYHFKVISPERVDQLLRQLIDPAKLKRDYRSAVDRDARILVATTTPEIQQQIESLKKQLDVATTAEASPIQFYKLSNTTAADVLATIRGIEGDETAALPVESPLGSYNSAMGSSAAGTSGAATQPAGFSSGTSSTASQNAALAAPRGFQAKDATIASDPNTNSIIVVAEPSVQKIYEQLIHQLDKRRPQVLIECTIISLDTTNHFQLGVDIGRSSGFRNSDVITFSSFGIGVPQTTGGPGTPATGRLALVPGAAGFNGALISSGIADIIVNALLRSGHARVVSAPRILVNDNATGTLKSLAQQPYTSINLSTTASTTTFGGYADAGTTIKLTPHISEADYLQLEYDISLDSFIGTSANGIPPPRQTNSLDSVVTIPDGSTIIVGGLNQETTNKNVDAIPILGQIPILGYLFSSHTDDHHKSTLFVFVRPVILRDDKFKDLRYLSQRDMRQAKMPDGQPDSEPLLIR